MDHSHLVSDIMKKRETSLVARFTQMVKGSSETLRFTAGLPNPETFPFSEMTISMTDGTEFTIDQQKMAECLQYGSPKGYSPLIQHLKALVMRLHNPPRWQESDLIIIPGTQDGLHNVFEMLLNPDDILLVPEPCYAGVINAVLPFRPQLLGVECDCLGIKPDDLKEVLARCEVPPKGIPKILYVNPSGSNPNGTVWTEARRRLIYDVACQYDIVILEDDPYGFLQFDEVFPPSFLALDEEGRVIRLDSFSKILGGGLRVGYATGPNHLMDLLTIQVQSTVNHVSLISQATISEMISVIGTEGFIQNARMAQQFYKKQRDIMIEAAQKYLQGLCEWNVPAGGFYLWLKVSEIPDTRTIIMGRGLQRGFLAMPGCLYYVDHEKPCQYIRISYSFGSKKEFEEGFKILADIIREEIKSSRLTTAFPKNQGENRGSKKE